ncbi:metallophosphoesterase [Aminobacter sp. HY435]|uniref:metallophosphoesterase n=1 Tax=Aminobacter sp. HY435 TaxID=2970917 RepID=UPI0022B97A36|nr:metallophosphoesterase [Aminobacter sp. HY435]
MNFPRFGARNQPQNRNRLELDLTDVVVYAIGDVHGCHSELVSLERKIVADAAARPGQKLIVMLGDYINRGPDSARVLDHLLAPPPEGFYRICLCGNHEVQLLDYLDGNSPRDNWLGAGARTTLFSYGVDIEYLRRLYGDGDRLDAHIRSAIPPEHVAFMRGLPIMAFSRRFAFVHAGIRPGVPLLEQDDLDLLYIREPFFEGAGRLDRWVVHGHTPVESPLMQGRRLAIDTGAYKTGRLSAVRIAGKGGKFLQS